MSDFVTKDSGERQNFDSGARRDISTGKTRPDLISEKARLRWGDLMARGAEKYGANNWRLGMPMTRFLESAHRHLLHYELGDRTEDHLSAILFNVGAMIHFEGTEWDDINPPVIKDDFFYDFLTALDESETLHEWVIEVADETIDQLELQPADDDVPMINWDSLKQQVEAGQIDGSTVRWPDGYQAPTTEG